MAQVLNNQQLLDRRMKGLSFNGVKPPAPMGMVRGLGTGKSDSNLVAASDGEYVLPEATTQAVGADNLDELVRGTTGEEPGGKPVMPHKGLQGFASGGVIGEDAITAAERLKGVRGATPTSTTTLGARVAGAQQGVRDVRAARAATSAVGSGLAGKLVRGTVAAAPLAGFGDYRVNDPSVDSSALGTLGNVARGNFSGALEGVKKGAVEAGLDGVAGLAKTGDWAAGLVGADPRLAQRFESRVKSDLGDMIQTPSDRREALDAVHVAPSAVPTGQSTSPVAPSTVPAVPGLTPEQAQVLDGAAQTNYDSYRNRLGASTAAQPVAQDAGSAGLRALASSPALREQLNQQYQMDNLGVQAATDANGRMVFSDAPKDPNRPTVQRGLSSGGDLKASNEGLARANAVRQEYLDSFGGGGGGVIGNSGPAETQALFDKWSTEPRAGERLTRSERSARTAQRNADLQDARARDTLAQQAQEGQLNRESAERAATTRGLGKGGPSEWEVAKYFDQRGREDAKTAAAAAEKADTRLDARADRERADRGNNADEMNRLFGEEDGPKAYSAVARNRSARLEQLKQTGGDPAEIDALSAPMTTDELQRNAALYRIDQRMEELSKSGRNQGLAAGVPGAVAGALRTPGGPWAKALGAAVGGLGGGALGYASGSQNAPSGDYKAGDLNQLLYEKDGTRNIPQIDAEGNLHLANNIIVPAAALTSDDLRIFGYRRPFASDDPDMQQALRSVGARGLGR